MLAKRITGATRVIGRAQGYFGLAVRDEKVNCSVNGDGTPAMVTAWEPTPEELVALGRGASIEVVLLGEGHPPINVRVGATPGDAHG